MMISHYALPASRLEKVGEIEFHELLLSKILSSPSHPRAFDVDEEIRVVPNWTERVIFPNLHFSAPSTATTSPS